MSEDLKAPAAVDASERPGWQRALADLERSLGEASRAVAVLRRCLAGDDEAVTGGMTQGLPSKGEAGRSAFDRLWERIENEQELPDGEPAADSPEERRGLDLLPQQYLITVEDRDGSVDLVPLHRALQDLDEVEEISLVSYANGVPVISIRAQGEIDLEQLDRVVATAMDRQCEVIPQDNGKLYVRMQARED